MKNVPRLVPGWTDPIVVGRHAFGDQYRATDFRVPGPGKLRMVFEGEDGTRIDEEGFQFHSSGVSMGMRSEERSVGKVSVSKCKYRWSTNHSIKKYRYIKITRYISIMINQ